MKFNDQLRIPVWLAVLLGAGVLGLGFAVGVSQGARAIVLSEVPIPRADHPDVLVDPKTGEQTLATDPSN